MTIELPEILAYVVGIAFFVYVGLVAVQTYQFLRKSHRDWIAPAGMASRRIPREPRFRREVISADDVEPDSPPGEILTVSMVCDSCTELFSVTTVASGNSGPVAHCPFCGSAKLDINEIASEPEGSEHLGPRMKP